MGSPTWHHQRATYGPDATYDDFVALRRRHRGADMDAIAGCAGMPVPAMCCSPNTTTGFCLWPSDLTHPRRALPRRRDIVSDLRRAVLDAGLRIGLYYSGGYDWPYNDALLKTPLTVSWPSRTPATTCSTRPVTSAN